MASRGNWCVQKRGTIDMEEAVSISASLGFYDKVSSNRYFEHSTSFKPINVFFFMCLV